MAIVNGYCSLSQIKADLGIATADTTDDTILEGIVEAVSREIDGYCGRRFYAATQTRYFTALCRDRLLVDDLLSVTTLKTDADADGTYETTWATTDYRLAPYNAQLESVPEPYWRIEVSPLGNNLFPCHARGVEIAGSWGFSSTTPDVIERVCLYQAALAYRTSKAVGGASGRGEMATEIRGTGLLRATMMMLAPYRRIVVA